MKKRYTSAFRVSTNNLKDLEQNLRKYKNSFDEVLFFTQFTHSVKRLEYHRESAEKIRPYLQKIKQLGIKTGINVMATIGFFAEALDDTMQNAKPYIYWNGSAINGRICPSDKANIEFIKEQYKIYARLSPDIIYIDDDISSLSCACDGCLERFHN
ncbi:MAG: hypothetical protein SPH68_05885 [Candidatus Borkfalkiaceae bacterium]|nr:hypothetical protein [Clostridia bacterium]MDY6223671.1 hypothetical protein [Christensenellaceae bacterium]